jgi:hypothetical protein
VETRDLARQNRFPNENLSPHENNCKGEEFNKFIAVSTPLQDDAIAANIESWDFQIASRTHMKSFDRTHNFEDLLVVFTGCTCKLM